MAPPSPLGLTHAALPCDLVCALLLLLPLAGAAGAGAASAVAAAAGTGAAAGAGGAAAAASAADADVAAELAAAALAPWGSLLSLPSAALLDVKAVCISGPAEALVEWGQSLQLHRHSLGLGLHRELCQQQALYSQCVSVCSDGGLCYSTGKVSIKKITGSDHKYRRKYGL